VTSPSPERNGKAALRAQLLARRDQLSEDERRRGEAAIAAHAEATLAARAAGDIIAVYAAKGSEVCPLAIDARARQLGLRVAYPRVVRAQRHLTFALAAPEELVAAAFGLREPAASAPELSLDEIRCFFVPGLAFDEAGGRVGWGRGYYDNTFGRAPRALRIGLAFECQVVERVPQAEHDILLHGLFTEARARRFGA
jgi:5-formyltetrahydrofolate cyclo-ligase